MVAKYFSSHNFLLPTELLYKNGQHETNFIGSKRKSIIKGRNMDNYFPLHPTTQSNPENIDTDTGII